MTAAREHPSLFSIDKKRSKSVFDSDRHLSQKLPTEVLVLSLSHTCLPCCRQLDPLYAGCIPQRKNRPVRSRCTHVPVQNRGIETTVVFRLYNLIDDIRTSASFQERRRCLRGTTVDTW